MARVPAEKVAAMMHGSRCGHCAAMFPASRSQVLHHFYDGLELFCSHACRMAARPTVARVLPRYTCRGCGGDFGSKATKAFCTQKCYMGSPQFRAMMLANAAKGAAASSGPPLTGEHRPCPHCAKPIYIKKHELRAGHGRRYCSKRCYRAYMAARFDRWIASPEGMALPQCYDEFLDRAELQCIVGDCAWVGHGLTQHVNAMHGLPRDEFKRAAGFALKTGVVSAVMAKALSGRRLAGVAIDPPAAFPVLRAGRAPNVVTGYRSLEGKEHHAKARALLATEPGPVRPCKVCGREFQQRTLCGLQLYCTTRCRSVWYSIGKRAKLGPLDLRVR